jgi:hypothetical protein
LSRDGILHPPLSCAHLPGIAPFCAFHLITPWTH